MNDFEQENLLSPDTKDFAELNTEESKVEVSEELSEEALDDVAGGAYLIVINDKIGGLGWQYDG